MRYNIIKPEKCEHSGYLGGDVMSFRTDLNEAYKHIVWLFRNYGSKAECKGCDFYIKEQNV